MAEAGAQGGGPVRCSTVEPPQTSGSGHGAGAERSRPGREGTGTWQSGGRPEPQDETEHCAAGGTLVRADDPCVILTSEISWKPESLRRR